MMARAGKRVLPLWGEEWRAELGLDGLVLRSGSGSEWRFPRERLVDAFAVWDAAQRGEPLEPLDGVDPAAREDWLWRHGGALVLDYFFGEEPVQKEDGTR